MLFTQKIIYRQILLRLLNCGDRSCKIFYVNFFIVSHCLKRKFCVGNNTRIKLPGKKDKKPSFRQMEKHDKAGIIF